MSLFYIPETKTEIKEKIDQLVNSLDPADKLVVYYCIELASKFEAAKDE